MKYTKKPVTVEAHQWFKNGDHPEDNCGVYQRQTGPNGEMMDYTGEGNVVRYFRRPDVSGQSTCEHCGNIMHNHGWIDTLEGGHIVCPGDYIITGIKGERYPCKPDIFEATYSIGDELATLRPKAKAYDEAMSIPLSDGTRLKLGEAFTVKDTYPFFWDGLENYNATLEWDDESKHLFYDIYAVSDRVSGRACGGAVEDIEWENVVRRKVRVCKEVEG